MYTSGRYVKVTNHTKTHVKRRNRKQKQMVADNPDVHGLWVECDQML